MGGERSLVSAQWSFGDKFGAGGLVLIAAVVGVAVVVYTTLAPELSDSGTELLLWGLASLVGTVVVWVALFAATVGRQWRRSMRRVAERAHRLEKGDRDVKLPTEGKDEFAALNRWLAKARDELGDGQLSVDTYRQAMDAVAEGDLRIRIDPGADEGPEVAMAESFNRMMDSLDRRVAAVRADAAEVSDGAERIARQAEQSRQATEAVAGVGKPAANGSTVQSGSNGQKSINSGETDVLEADNPNGPPFSEALTEVRESIARFDRRMNEVDELSEYISDVADETNMLALNASIEASKIEAENDGFETVADEISALARETGMVAARIETIGEATREETTGGIDAILHRQALAFEKISERAAKTTRASGELCEHLTGLSVSEQPGGAATGVDSETQTDIKGGPPADG